MKGTLARALAEWFTGTLDRACYEWPATWCSQPPQVLRLCGPLQEARGIHTLTHTLTLHSLTCTPSPILGCICSTSFNHWPQRSHPHGSWGSLPHSLQGGMQHL